MAYIAASYVAVGADVAVISLRGDTSLAARLQPLGVAVIQAKDGEQAKKRLGAARPLLTLIDTPAVGLSSTPGEIKALAAELQLLEVTEVHLALPATLSAAAADELSEALSPLGATHVVLSHADETKRPGRADRARAQGRASAVLHLRALGRQPRRPRRAGRAAAPMSSSSDASAPTLAPGQHVIVRNVHVGMLPATIEKADAATVTVALAVKDERMPRLVGHEMAVEITSGRGIHRYTGTLSGERAGSLTITLSGDIERIQRREFVRVAAHLDVTIARRRRGGRRRDHHARPVRPRHADRRTSSTCRSASTSGSSSSSPTAPPLSALGRVVRVGSEEDQKGIRFDSVSRADEDRLMRYIRDREVKALRASRG